MRTQQPREELLWLQERAQQRMHTQGMQPLVRLCKTAFGGCAAAHFSYISLQIAVTTYARVATGCAPHGSQAAVAALHTSLVGICVGCRVTRRSSFSMCISVVFPALSRPCDAGGQRSADAQPREQQSCSDAVSHARRRPVLGAIFSLKTHQKQDFSVFVVQSERIERTVDPARRRDRGNRRAWQRCTSWHAPAMPLQYLPVDKKHPAPRCAAPRALTPWQLNVRVCTQADTDSSGLFICQRSVVTMEAAQWMLSPWHA
jgi:hypothetical protein